MVTGNGALARAVSHVCSCSERSARYWIVSCRTAVPPPWAKVAVRAWTSGSPAWRLGQVRQRQEDVAVGQDQVPWRRRRPAAGAPGRVHQGHAVTAVVRDDHGGLGAQHLRQVELQELRIAREAVTPPLGFA